MIKTVEVFKLAVRLQMSGASKNLQSLVGPRLSMSVFLRFLEVPGKVPFLDLVKFS